MRNSFSLPKYMPLHAGGDAMSGRSLAASVVFTYFLSPPFLLETPTDE